MCKLASVEVLPGYAVRSLPDSDSHSEIIRQLKLHVDGSHGPNCVSVEITPPKGGNINSPLKGWLFRVDQDTLPAWWDAKLGEKACRKHLALMIPARKKYTAKRKLLYDDYVAKCKLLTNVYWEKRDLIYDNYYAATKQPKP